MGVIAKSPLFGRQVSGGFFFHGSLYNYWKGMGVLWGMVVTAGHFFESFDPQGMVVIAGHFF
jgi:hypothetical protein